MSTSGFYTNRTWFRDSCHRVASSVDTKMRPDFLRTNLLHQFILVNFITTTTQGKFPQGTIQCDLRNYLRFIFMVSTRRKNPNFFQARADFFWFSPYNKNICFEGFWQHTVRKNYTKPKQKLKDTKTRINAPSTFAVLHDWGVGAVVLVRAGFFFFFWKGSRFHFGRTRFLWM